MKKKILLFLIIICLFSTKLYAETAKNCNEVPGTTTATCIETPEGHLRIKWSGNTKRYSKVYVKVCDHDCKDSGTIHTYKNKDDCEEEKKKIKECNFEASDGKNSVKTSCQCRFENNEYKLTKQNCTPKIKNNGECEWKLETANVKASEYILLEAEQTTGHFETEGDTAYCLQPNKTGPGKIKSGYQDYILDKSFDVSVCKDSLHKKSGEDDFRCGLAHILYQTVTEKNGKYVPNKSYTYDAITFALRLWVAEYGNESFPMGNPSTWSHEQGSADSADSNTDDFVLNYDNNYYKITADTIINGTYDAKVTAIKKYIKDHDNGKINSKKLLEKLEKEGLGGIIYCSTDKGCSVPSGIELFKSALEASKNPSKFLGGRDFNKEVPVVNNHTSTGSITTEIDLPESIEEVECSEEDVKAGKCSVHVRYFDEDGNDITDEVEITGSCGKRHCTFTTTYSKKCIKGGKKKITTKVSIDNYKWERNNGYVRFYTHAKEPQNYQKFITFAFNIEKCEDECSETEYEETVETWCDDVCENMNPIKKIPTMCDVDSEYTTSSIIDPNMNCILNSINEAAKNKYDYTERLNANSNICRIYCREEIAFYTPGIVSTYAGKQFQYDLGSVLKKYNVISSTVADSISPVHKLTGLLIRKKQCTSKIDYNKWKKEYDKKTNLMVQAYESNNTSNYNLYKKEVSEWIYGLQNCNLYTTSDIKDPYNLSKKATTSGTSKDYVVSESVCKNANCPELTVSYDDKTYGGKNNLGKVASAIDTKSNGTYYCKNSEKTKCYEYKSDSSVEINAGNFNSNSLTSITYKDCNNKKCSDKTIKLPNNDYATFVVKTEFDYYQQKEYQTDVSSGVVSEIGTNNNNNKTPIEKYSYPVSNNTKASFYDKKTNIGGYNFNYSLSNASTNEKVNINYYCKYNVNVANKPEDPTDCDEDDPNCDNIIKEGNQFIYRSVDLSNLFPNGIENRPKNNNWSNKQKEIEAIQRTSNDIFTNKDYLEYRYVLTPQTIKDIKKYNKNQRVNGGYLNNTLVDCEYVDSNGNKCDSNKDLCEFRNCKSTFLTKDIKEYSGIEISGNKAGGK